LLEVAAVTPYATSAILLVAQVVDAIADPIIGRISDRTRSRFGRRRPWIVFGAIPGALCYVALWQVPTAPGDSLLAYYYGVLTVLVTLTHTVVAVPYAALTTELSDDYDERTSLTMWRVGAGVLGGTAAVALHSVLVESFTSSTTGAVDYLVGYGVSALALGSIVGVAPLITGITASEKYASEAAARDARQRQSYWQSLRTTFSSRAFVLAAMMYTLSWLAIANVQNNLFLWCKYVLNREGHFTYIIVLIQLMAAVSLWLWSFVSTRIGKRSAFAVSCVVLTGLLGGAYFLTDETPLAVLYVIAGAAGLGLGGAMLLPWSMLPDVVDADELQTGERREGDFYGLFVMLQKVGLGLALAGSSLALGAAGYVSPETEQGGDHQHTMQPDDVKLVLRLLIGPLPGGLMFIALFFTLGYPLSRSRHREIRRQLFARHVAGATEREEKLLLTD
jgi:GPH family glycoside/pentoside/hexuronide:cation symporter